MPTNNSSLSLAACKILDQCGVETPAQLPRPSDKNVLWWFCYSFGYEPAAGREIIKWARQHGVQFGPSQEWLVLLYLGETLRHPIHTALWHCAFATDTPKGIPPEKVLAYAKDWSKKDTAKFRAWTEKHKRRFGASRLKDPDGWYALSVRAKRVSSTLDIWDEADLKKHSRSALGELQNCAAGTIAEIEDWASKQSADLPE